jgi:predicted amidohydrolase
VPVDVDAGSEQRVLDTGKRKLGPLICFEVLLGSLAENLREMDADVLVVLSNMSWFGGSSALSQELEMARMRSIETRLPLIQSANTGISGVFDPYGRFTPVNAMLWPSGRYAKWENDTINPRLVVMQRCLGALLVAEPARRPVPFNPALFSWVAMAAALLLVILSIAFPGDSASPSAKQKAEETGAAPTT